MTMLEFAEAVKAAGRSLGLPGAAGKFVYKPFPENDPKRRQPDITKAKQGAGLGAAGIARRGVDDDHRVVQVARVRKAHRQS